MIKLFESLLVRIIEYIYQVISNKILGLFNISKRKTPLLWD